MNAFTAVILTALSMFIGMGLYSIVATYVITRKWFIRWAFMKGFECAKEEEELVEKILE